MAQQTATATQDALRSVEAESLVHLCEVFVIPTRASLAYQSKAGASFSREDSRPFERAGDSIALGPGSRPGFATSMSRVRRRVCP
jgi:hypothetical protein